MRGTQNIELKIYFYLYLLVSIYYFTKAKTRCTIITLVCGLGNYFWVRQHCNGS